MGNSPGSGAPDKPKNILDELLSESKVVRSEQVKALADVLKFVQLAKEMAPVPPAAGDAAELLAGLADLHSQTLKGLTELGAKHTAKMATVLKEKREKVAGVKLQTLRVLVRPKVAKDEKEDLEGTFVIRNESATDRVIPLPDSVQLHELGTSCTCEAPSCEKCGGVFVEIRFLDDAKGTELKAPKASPLPYEVTIPNADSLTIRLRIPGGARRKGRYRGIVPLAAKGAPHAELIIEIEPRD